MKGKIRPLEVLVFGRSGFIGSFVFKASRISLGRDVEAMVRLDDPMVSLKHAELTLEGGLFRLKDLGSRTGTRVNGAPVLPRQPLEPTDEISIGPFRLRVTTLEPESIAPPSNETARAQAAVPSVPPLPALVPSDRPPPTAPAPAVERASVREPEPKLEPASVGAAPEPTTKREAARIAPVPTKLGWLPSPIVPQKAAATAPVARLAPEDPTAVSGNALGAAGPATDRETTVVVPVPTKAVSPRGPGAAAALPVTAPVAAVAAPGASLGDYVATQVDLKPVHPSAGAPAARGEVRLETPREPVPLAFAVSAVAGGEPAVVDEDDEDDEDDSDFVPPFDLIDALSSGGFHGDPVSDGKATSLEVVHYRAGRILSVRHPRVKGPLRAHGLPEPIGVVEDDGSFSFHPEACRAFAVREGGRTLTIQDVLARRDGAKLRLVPGMLVSVDLVGDDRVMVHWVLRAQALVPPRVSLRPSTDGITTGGLSIALHLAIGLFIGIVVLGGKKQADSDINAGRFATIATKELELEPPPPTPPPEIPAPDAVTTTDTLPPTMHDQAASKSQVPAPAGARHAGPDSAPASASAQRILSALGGAPSAISVDAISVTNLDALPVAAGGFKVSGSVGKAPGDTLRVAVAGGGGREVDTKSASELGGNSLGRVAARGEAGGGAVRARVTAAPQAIRGEGHLDRGEIQKVVNAHLYQVQGCYERQLARDPSLAGKISYEWVVDVSGGVSSVRIGRSTVHSVEVTTCIQSAIQGWKFPPPQGGSVTVTYPFAFSALGG